MSQRKKARENRRRHKKNTRFDRQDQAKRVKEERQREEWAKVTAPAAT